MKAARLLTFLVAACCPAFAAGEVLNAAPGGFTVQHERLVAADRADAWTAALSVGDWWSDDHTVAGDAGRMRIEPRPLGCFCEYLGGDDGVVHLTVTSVSSPVMLRMTGGLGPLGLLGVDGNMTWEFFDDVAGTRIRFTYAVGGFYDKGLDTLAAPVDAVIGDALARLQDYIERD